MDDLPDKDLFDESDPDDQFLYEFNDIGLALRINAARALADA